MSKKLFVLIGGSDAQNGDYSRVLRFARRGGTANWSSLRGARQGDRVLVYIRQRPGALVAKAEVLTDPVKGKPGDYAYRATIGKFEVLPNQPEIGDLKREFPSWDWLRFPRRGTRVPDKIADRLWKLVHQKQSRVQILISNSGYGQRRLETLNGSERAVYWTAPMLTRTGDTLLFYVERPVSAIVAVGRALSGTRPTSGKCYEATVGEIRMLESPIALKELRRMFPGWAWLKNVSMFAYVSSGRAKALLEKCCQDAAAQANSSKQRTGAGFGNAETNPLVERAAVGAVTRHFRRRGFKVVSREKDSIGYDLDAIRSGTTWHVEVKGVSGSLTRFLITKNEVNCAYHDPKFRLAVVTEARMPKRRIQLMTGKGLLRRFELKPVSLIAESRQDAKV